MLTRNVPNWLLPAKLYECHRCGGLRVIHYMRYQKWPKRFPCDKITVEWLPELGRVRVECGGVFILRPSSARDFVLSRETP